MVHILKGHPELEDRRDKVENAIESPIEIRYSLNDKDCRIYYGDNETGRSIIQVIVDIVLKLVKTAHKAKKITGGDVEWSSQTQSKE